VSDPGLEAVEVEPRAKADAAVVLLHGLGADGHDFESIVPELRLPASPSIRWVFPHAPVRPVTINGGTRMRAWYDVIALDRRASEDEEGIRSSSRAVAELVRRERERGVDASRIVLAGFSQGGALALFTALRSPERLAGVAALSSYLPLASSLEDEAHPASATLPVFLAHGSFDPIVAPALGLGSRDVLRSRGHDVEWHEYPMPHSVCAQEVTDLREWLLRALAGPRPFTGTVSTRS
jgi:phospholipase/carboxylesterase